MFGRDDDSSGSETITTASLREYFAVRYELQPNEIDNLFKLYASRIETGKRFKETTRNVAIDIMAAYSNSRK